MNLDLLNTRPYEEMYGFYYNLCIESLIYSQIRVERINRFILTSGLYYEKMFLLL